MWSWFIFVRSSPLSFSYKRRVMLPWLLLVIFVSVFWQLSLYLRRRRTSKGLPLPPGPKGLPFIGNVLDFPKEFAWKRFVEWGSRYGQSFQ